MRTWRGALLHETGEPRVGVGGLHGEAGLTAPLDDDHGAELGDLGEALGLFLQLLKPALGQATPRPILRFQR